MSFLHALISSYSDKMKSMQKNEILTNLKVYYFKLYKQHVFVKIVFLPLLKLDTF